MITTTDNKWHEFKYWLDVPADVMKSEFDWLSPDEATDGFFKYRGSWYHMSEFEYTNSFPGWHGFKGDSFFSGVVIQICDDGESYKIGTIIC